MASRRRTRQSSITGNISDVQRRLKYLEARPAPSKLGNYSVKPSNLEPRAVGTDQLGIGVVVQATVGTDAIGNDELGLDAVDAENVRQDAIGNSELGLDAAQSENIQTDAVGNTEIGSDAVDSSEIKQDGVGSSELGIDAASAENILVDGVGSSEISSNAVDSSELAPDGVGNSELGIDAATSENIAMNQVGSSEIADNSVDTAAIVDGAVTPAKIAPNSITAEQIDSGAIGNDELASESVDTQNYVFASVDLNAMGAGAVDSTVLADDSVYWYHINANTIGGSYDSSRNNITAGSIGGNDLKNRGIPNTKIELQGITAAELGPDSVGTSELANLAVYTGNINDGAVTGAKADTGFVRSIGTGGAITASRAGTAVVIGITTGTTNGTVAAGNHTHTGGTTTVPAHTHSFTGGSISLSGGTHTATGSGAHSHSSTTSGTVGGVQTSTRRMKREITDYEFDAKKLLQLRLTQFKYKNAVRDIQDAHNREWMYGYIAEEVLDAGVEEILVYDKNKEPIALNYGILSTLIIELLKTQQAEIDSLKEEVQRLKDDK